MGDEKDAGPRLFSGVGIAGAFAGFVLIGALQALYGPAIPAVRAHYGVSPAVGGLGLSAHFVGGLLGVVVFHRCCGKTGNRLLLGCSYLAMAAGAVVFAATPPWPVALLGAFVAGLGYGSIDYGLNHLFAIGFGARSPAMLNLLNAFFGIGSILAPVALAQLGPESYPLVFFAFAIASAVLIAALRGVRNTRVESGGTAPDRDAMLRNRSIAITGAFVILYVLNIGVEAGAGGWEPTHLIAAGHTASAATSATAVYWLMMTVGRFLVAPLTLRWSEQSILTWSCVGMAVCLALAVVPSLAPYAYAGLGLFIAPVFPTGLPWLHRLVPDAQRAGAYVIAASMLGGVVFPPLIGVGIELASTTAVPIILFGLNALCLLAIWWLLRQPGAPRDVAQPGDEEHAMTGDDRSRLKTALRRLDAWSLRVLNPPEVFLAVARHDFRHRRVEHTSPSTAPGAALPGTAFIHRRC
ncbi:Fucose permease [Saccharopolyspora antimicrobica]|uniref:Fucose permease n=1 Tax=Saccharopolyspora antimicrobica TaxID=455193 RepID=A0A1I4RW14_9PSEU|nr:MFS transporter [Saccharopolyspora antimicrobica]RKT89160.1 fucose permease [Saccharopolyspora antimicrobica]SFM56203.1 Fucose permease [Saccharopolyspora antimicrobica]